MYNIRTIKGPEELEKLLEIRKKVFVDEQGVPEEREKDEFEHTATHFAVLDKDIIGGARVRILKKRAKLERIVITPEYQGKGVGKQLVAHLIDYSNDQKVKEVYLHGQTRIRGFYERMGFTARGAPFEDGGIEHLDFFMSQKDLKLRKLIQRFYMDPDFKYKEGDTYFDRPKAGRRVGLDMSNEVIEKKRCESYVNKLGFSFRILNRFGFEYNGYHYSFEFVDHKREGHFPFYRLLRE